MGAYLTQTDLENALSPQTILAIFDDNNDGTADATPIAAVIARAEGQVHSYLSRAYPALVFPLTGGDATSAVLKQAALAYAVPYAWQRHPEYMRMVGAGENVTAPMLRAADEMMERLCEGQQFLFGVTAQPKPTTVGGIIYDSGPRTCIDGRDGSSNGGDF